LGRGGRWGGGGREEWRRGKCQIFKNIGMTKINVRWIRGRKDSSHLSSGIVHNHICKGNKQKMSPISQIPWGKGRDRSL